MKIVVTADLHFEVGRSADPARRMAARLCETKADALIIAGDTTAFDRPTLADALRHFDGFPGAKFLIAGNHDLWTIAGDSRRIYAGMGDIARSTGFHFLDDGPAVRDGVGFVGNVGWFDFGFRKNELGIPLRYYKAKVSPGAAAMMAEHVSLGTADPADPPSARALAIRARWMDGVRVRWDWTDDEFLQICLDRLDKHLRQVEREVDRIVVAVHHVPFAELLPDPDRQDDRLAFAAAYLGSARIGELLLTHPKVCYVFCGHSHWPRRMVRGGMTAINVGSTYEIKRLVEVDV